MFLFLINIFSSNKIVFNIIKIIIENVVILVISKKLNELIIKNTNKNINIKFERTKNKSWRLFLMFLYTSIIDAVYPLQHDDNLLHRHNKQSDIPRWAIAAGGNSWGPQQWVFGTQEQVVWGQDASVGYVPYTASQHGIPSLSSDPTP